MDRRGSILLATLVALLVAAIAVATFHRLAVDVLRTARGGLAALRAREAAAAGLHGAAGGLGTSGALSGGASWWATTDTIAPGLLLFRSTGRATVPAAAVLEVAAFGVVPDSSPGAGSPVPTLSGWIEIRHD